MKSSSTTSAKSDSTEETSQPSSSSSVNKVLSQSTIDTNIFHSVIKAEIIWSLFSVCEEFSNNSAKYLNQTFPSMFLECPTAQKFQLGHDKLKYVINWSLAPHFKDLLKKKL